MTNKSNFYLGDTFVEPLRCVIKVGQEERHVEPQVMSLLLHLATHPGQVVTREELLQVVWPDCFVNDGALSKAVSILRKALGDQARNPQYIQTIPKVGYRLIVPVRPVAILQLQNQLATAPQLPAMPHQTTTSVHPVNAYKSPFRARAALGYLMPAAIVALLFVFQPKQIEIEEDIVYTTSNLSEMQVTSSVLDSTQIPSDSLVVKERTLIYPASNIEVHLSE